ncbi:MAG: TerB family tellurite resistance protein [Pseudomonadales bacterium]
MSITNLGNILKIFGGAEPTEEEKQAVFKEAAMMTLARATASDTNIKSVEVETVRVIIERVTGEDVSEADVRVAANSKLFESAPLEKYLARAGRQMNVKDRLVIAEALAEVIVSDSRISSKEITFFNMLAEAFELTPAELAGLIEAD